MRQLFFLQYYRQSLPIWSAQQFDVLLQKDEIICIACDSFLFPKQQVNSLLDGRFSHPYTCTYSLKGYIILKNSQKSTVRFYSF
jgi:hypothetical protein